MRHGVPKRCSGHIVVWCDSQTLAETLPHTGIMTMRECFCEVTHTSARSSPSWKRTSTAATMLPVDPPPQLGCVGTESSVLSSKRCTNSGCPTGRRVPSPHNGFRFHSSSCSGEDVNPTRWNSSSVQHLSPPMMQRDLCMVLQFLLQNSVDLKHPVWCTDRIN